MSIRYERDEEFIATALRRVGGGLRDVQRPTGTEKARTVERVEEVAVESAFAKELAEELGVNVGELSGEVAAAALVAASAQSAADAAQLEAETARSEATSKSAAAESAAKLYAEAEAEAARLAAVAVASGDATDKAAAAEAAAVLVAAADATAKANAAELAAKADAAAAQSTADTALSDAAAAQVAAGSATTIANQAQATASGKSKIFRSTSAPSGMGTADGDKWEQYDSLDAGGKLTGTWAWFDGSWRSTVISETYLPLVNIGSGTYGTLAGARLAATAIDGMTVTGALIRTAASGQRMQFDVDGLKSFSSLGVLTSVLSAFNGRFLLSSVADSSGLELTPEAIWLKNGSSIHGALGKYGLQVYPTPGLSAQYVSDRAFVRREVIHPTSGAATNRVEMNGGSDGYVSISAGIDTDSGSVRNTSAELSASFDSSGVPYSRATADVGLFNELRTFVNPTDPTTGSSPLNVTVSAGFAVNSKLVAGDALRGNATKMNALHSNGLAYDGLKFWRTDQLCFYIYIGGLWIKESTPETDTGWVPLTNFGTGWSSVAQDGYPALSARRRNGVVELRGVVQKATWAAFETIVTLPTNLRPIHNTDGVCRYGYAAAVAASQVFSNGQVRITVAGSALVILAGTWMLG